jgi:uncharacterized iron-regulated membrane protein
MGILLGLPNQLLLIGFGVGLCLMIVIGYRLWWIRRPASPSASPTQTLVQSWLMLSGWGRVGGGLLAIVLGLAMPVLGGSLLLFMLVDWLRWVYASRAVIAQSAD